MRNFYSKKYAWQSRQQKTAHSFSSNKSPTLLDFLNWVQHILCRIVDVRNLTVTKKLFDKIYSVKCCEIFLFNGQTYRMSNEQLFSVMFNIIALRYEDVVAMLPLMKMDPSILHKLSNDFMNAITTIGYDVVVCLVHGLL